MSDDDTTDLLVITQFFPPESMGGAHRWEKLTANLDDSIEPHVLCTFPTFPYGEFDRRWRPLSRETMHGVPVTRLFTVQPTAESTLGRILNYAVFTVLSSLYVLATFWRYDCIVTMSAPHTTFIPGLLGKLTGRRWVIDIFDLWIDNAADLGYVDEESLAYRLVSALERLAFARADAVFVITDTMAEYYDTKYPEVTFDVHVIPFGVDRNLFTPSKAKEETADVIYTGNLGTGQAFRPFLKGFAALDESYKLMIVGDGERRRELESLVDELGISDRVSFEGYVDRARIPELVAGSKVSLVPLKTEYQLDYARPTKLLESMAVGTPYIASSVTEIEELSRGYGTGIPVENQAASIHKSLQKLLQHPQKREEMGSRAVEIIEDQHDWNKVATEASQVILGA